VTANHESHESWHLDDCAECARIFNEEVAYHRGLYRSDKARLDAEEDARYIDGDGETWERRPNGADIQVDEAARDRADWILMEDR